MRILALPRDDNPAQELLYGPMRARGAHVAYLGELTRSRTLNVLLLPLELAARRLGGWRVVHLHWVFAFSLPGAWGRSRAGRMASALWFRLVLASVRALGMRLVWTAHNALPHAQVFPDDVAERRRLVRAADLVIAHSQAALAEVTRIAGRPRRAVVIPLGPYAPDGPPPAPARRGGPRHLVFFGKVQEHKGVEDLIAAATALPDVDLRVTVAGECADALLRRRLAAMAGAGDGRVALRLERVPDEEVTRLMAAADAVALPYRAGTTSSAAALALAHGRPVLVPRITAFADVPDGAALRYDGTRQGLATSLRAVAEMDPERLAAMAAAARAHRGPGWDEVAVRTALAIDGIRGNA